MARGMLYLASQFLSVCSEEHGQFSHDWKNHYVWTWGTLAIVDFSCQERPRKCLENCYIRFCPGGFAPLDPPLNLCPWTPRCHFKFIVIPAGNHGLFGCHRNGDRQFLYESKSGQNPETTDTWSCCSEY